MREYQITYYVNGKVAYQVKAWLTKAQVREIEKEKDVTIE